MASRKSKFYKFDQTLLQPEGLSSINQVIQFTGESELYLMYLSQEKPILFSLILESISSKIRFNSFLETNYTLNTLVSVLSKYSPNDVIPNERELAALTGFDRNTIRESLSKLQTLGYVLIRHGKKTKLIKSIPT